nr:stage V sporulation protein T [Maliibacterium massiliense]
MKATGIVRRIDDLGRVVIPKEIRRTMRIREGDPLEIYTDREGEIILKKYSPIGELNDFAREYVEALSRVSGHVALIADRDNIVAVSGASRREYQDKPLHKDMERFMHGRRSVQLQGEQTMLLVVEDADVAPFTALSGAPILADGEVIGAVLLASGAAGAHMDDQERKLVETAAIFLGRQMEG